MLQQSNNTLIDCLPIDHSPMSNPKPITKISSLSQQYSESAKISFKIVVIGQSFVGKTSLIQKFVKQDYSTEYSVTVGVDFSSRAINLQGTLIQLQIWDTCGHDVFRSMTSSFYRGACGVFLVFALNDRKSFQKLNYWYDEFKESGSPHAMIIVIGTKSDQNHDVSMDQGMKMMKDMGGMFYVETSAETGEQIQELFNKTAEFMYKKYKISHEFRVLAQPRKHNKSCLLSSGFQQQGEQNENQRWSRMKKRCC